MGLAVTEDECGCTLWVHVVPRSSRDEITGLYGDALRVRLQAPPVDGKANRALCAFLARRLGLSKGAVEVVSGQTARRKLVRLHGARAAQVRGLVQQDGGK